MSSVSVTHKVDGQIFKPANDKELAIELNPDLSESDSFLTFQNVRFINEEAQGVFAIIQSYGFFEGVPYQIVITDQSITKTFDVYIDPTAEHTYSCDDIIVTLKVRKKQDWLYQMLEGFTLEYLNKHTTHLPNSLFVPVPYVISQLPNYRDIFITAFAGVYMVQALIEQATKVAAAVSQLVNPFGVDELIKAILEIAYFLTMYIAFLLLILDIINLIIQPVKYHKGMYFKDTFESICAHLGYNFVSSIFASGAKHEKIFYLPPKYYNPKDAQDDRILGFLNSNDPTPEGYFKGTASQWVQACKEMFNAEIWIIGNDLIFERRDWNNSSSTYTIPPVKSEDYKYNTDELISNYLVRFATDLSEANTIDQYQGNLVVVTTTISSPQNADLRLTKQLKEVNIPWALAVRKEELTAPELAVDAFLNVIGAVVNAAAQVVNSVISVVNSVIDFINDIDNILGFFGINVNINIPPVPPFNPPQLAQIINDRIGMLLLVNDHFTTGKVFILDEDSDPRQTDIAQNNRTILSAKSIYEDFHAIESFVPSSQYPNANQWRIKQIDNFEFCLEDFDKVEDNNRIFDSAGNVAKIEYLKYYPRKGTAEIRYRVNELYSNILKTEIDEPTGI